MTLTLLCVCAECRDGVFVQSGLSKTAQCGKSVWFCECGMGDQTRPFSVR
jgi:hypothetical protein